VTGHKWARAIGDADARLSLDLKSTREVQAARIGTAQLTRCHSSFSGRKHLCRPTLAVPPFR
jgi:hypothetical protein